MKTNLRRRRFFVSGAVAALAVTVVGVGAADAGNHPHRHKHRPSPTPSATPTPIPKSTTEVTPAPSPSTSTEAPAPTTPTATTTATGPASPPPASGMPKPSHVVFADHVAQFNVFCEADHFAADDPIVFPGQPGASHMHTFYGNTSTNAASTITSLTATSPSSCGRGMGGSDLSAYWVPSLMKKNADGTTSVVKTDQTNTVYYRRAGGGTGPGVLPFPVGLRMIAGNAKATSDQSLS